MADTEIELELGTGAQPGEYAVRVVRAASGGEPENRLQLNVDDLVNRRGRLEETVLASAARARRGIVLAAERPLREAGEELFEALFSGPVAEVYRASLAVARERGRRLRVVLRLTAPELSVLPWEALFDPVIDAYLCRKEPLVRHVPAPFSPEPLPVQPPLRILGLIASPRGLPLLDVEAEQQHLQNALAGPVAAGRVKLEWLTQASWDGVHGQLLTEQWHVLHFIGHGDYDPATDEGQVALVGADGRADWVEASRLADLLDAADMPPRLVVLNSCSSGQAGTRDLFSGTAATLVRSGISAVAAMQFSVSDRAAVAFPRGFYTAVATGRGVDEAVRNGRIAILGTSGGTLEWVTPVLYLRGNATRLFTLTSQPEPSVRTQDRTTAEPPSRNIEQVRTVPTASPTVSQDATCDARWAEGLSAFFAGRYDEAIERFEALQARYPGEARLQTRLDQARHQRDLATWSDQAEAAAENGDWTNVVDALERITAIDATYRSASGRLEQARTAQRCQALIDEINVLHQAGQWQAVLRVGEELARLDPSHLDPSALAHARQRLADADFAMRYDEGLRRLDQEQWRDAAKLFGAIERGRSGYRDAQALFAVALQHLPQLSGTIKVGEQVNCLAFSPDGTRIATSSPDSTARVWDITKGTRVLLAVQHDTGANVYSLAFSPDGTRIATGGTDNAVYVWDSTSGARVLTVRHNDSVRSIAFSPDGTRIATGSNDNTARVWDAASGAELRAVQHRDRVTSIAFSPDGTRIATGSNDNTARVWDAASGKELLAVEHSKSVRSIAFSPDGTRIATGSNDNTARVWDAASGKELLAVEHANAGISVAFDPNGIWLASGSWDRTVLVTQVP